VHLQQRYLIAAYNNTVSARSIILLDYINKCPPLVQYHRMALKLIDWRRLLDNCLRYRQWPVKHTTVIILAPIYSHIGTS